MLANDSAPAGGKPARRCKPRRFTRGVQRRFLELIERGHSEAKAARMVGVHPSTVTRHKWGKGFWWKVETARMLRGAGRLRPETPR